MTATLPPDLLELAGSLAVAHVATLLPDGSPHSVPVWIGVEDGRLAFLTSPSSRKGRNLAHDPRIAVSILDPANPARMAMVRGRLGTTLEGDPAWEVIDRISTKYIGGPYPLREDRVVFLVDADHVTVSTVG
jgi:PPOX class probable F420-dependent enzyme